MTETKVPHIPVLAKEAVEGLITDPNGVYVDATFGSGGHSREILKRLGPKGRLIAFDIDEEAGKYAIDAPNFILFHSSYTFIHNFLKYVDIEKVNGVLADLGVSSHHLDNPQRGFSYRFNAPLDMRMNPQQQFSAKVVVNEYSFKQLAEVIRKYGEFRNAEQIAEAIIEARKRKPLETTFDLVNAVKHLFPSRFLNKNLSKLFQAIRIEVNDELDNIKRLIKLSEEVLVPGGRLAIISFHSLEDRLVKNYFKTGNFEGILYQDAYSYDVHKKPFKPLKSKAITPSAEEIRRNPRARSAKLRIAERTTNKSTNG